MKESIWQQDITHHMIGTLAVFGLVVSSLVTGLGVAAVGVEAQMAFAQQGVGSQTAALVMADSTVGRPIPPPMNMGSTSMRDASTTIMREIKVAAASSTAPYCPKIAKTIVRGSKDATTTGDISELQHFLASRYNLEASSTVSGYFGPTTEGYLKKFQKEQGIAPSPSVGPLTRAAILKLCAGASSQMRELHPPMASSTRPMMGSTTTSPVSIQDYEGASNAAAVVSAIGEISDGYSHLAGAVLSLVGL